MNFSQANVRLFDIASIPASLLWIHHGMAIGRTATASSYGRCPCDVQIETSTVRCHPLAVEGYIASQRKTWDLHLEYEICIDLKIFETCALSLVFSKQDELRRYRGSKVLLLLNPTSMRP